MNRTLIALSTGLCLTAALVACATPSDTPPSAAAPAADPEVVARYGDQVVTEADLEREAGPALVKLRQQEFDTKMQVLNGVIFGQLVEQAAAAESLDPAAYMAREIDAALGEPDEAQVAQVMAQYRARLPKEDDQARQQVVAFLQQQQRQQLEAGLRDRLFAAAGVQILLEPPRVEADLSGRLLSRGPVDAPIVLVEYTDFQCPFCGRVQGTLEQLMERYDGKVRHVFKHLPLPMHAEAGLAGEASMCADDQGKFWELHHWMFDNRSNLSPETIGDQAAALGMDREKFDACIQAGTYRAHVEQDANEARSFGITGTPGFLVNGRILSGAQPYEAFTAIIDEELRRAGIEIPPPPAPETATTEAQPAS